MHPISSQWSMSTPQSLPFHPQKHSQTSSAMHRPLENPPTHPPAHEVHGRMYRQPHTPVWFARSP